MGVSSKEDRVFGIQELYCPPGGATVDIVAVHGLTGHAQKTWTTKQSNICWLSHPDFLPKYVKNARILSYGYNANVLGKNTSGDNIMDHAHTLVAHLWANRSLADAVERPIIFVCHSLGGLIVKRALIYSHGRVAPRIFHLHSIYTCTYGILFFGTPHNGSQIAKVASRLEKLAARTIPAKILMTENALLKALVKDSEILREITDNFVPLRKIFRVYYFWEQQKTNLKARTEYIVEKSSAAPDLDNTERHGIAADHSRMCKFETPDGDFRAVAEAVRTYSKDAPEEIALRVIRSKAEMDLKRRQEAEDLLRRVPNSAMSALNRLN